MTHTPTPANVVAKGNAAVDAFLALSQVYLASIERLSVLNLNTAREAVEDCAAAAKTLSEARAAQALPNLPSLLGQPMWEKSLAYSRSTYEIIARTQEEMSRAVVGQISQPHLASTVPAGWSAMFDMFTQGVQQLSASVAESVARATSAKSKAVAPVATPAKKAA